MKQIIDRALGLLQRRGLVNGFLRGETWAEKIGLACMYFVLPLLGVIFAVTYSRGLNRVLGPGTPVAIAVGFAVACIIMGYVADKMLEYVRPSINHAKTDIVNNAFFDVLAVVCTIASIGFGITTIALLFMGQITAMFMMLVLFALSMYFAVMLMSADKMLNVKTMASAGPAQSLIAITGLLVKASYRLVPFAFGLLVVLGVVSGLDMIIVSQHATIPNMMTFMYSLVGAALLPLVAYFVFLVYYFLIDWFCAFFRIADAVEKISESKSKSK